MATVSTRIDDLLKSEAEKIADEIGIPLSTAINIFLKRFISDKGFPFNVTVPPKQRRQSIIDENLLDDLVKKAVSEPNNLGLPRQFTYLDPNTQQQISIIREE